MQRSDCAAPETREGARSAVGTPSEAPRAAEQRGRAEETRERDNGTRAAAHACRDAAAGICDAGSHCTQETGRVTLIESNEIDCQRSVDNRFNNLRLLLAPAPGLLRLRGDGRLLYMSCHHVIEIAIASDCGALSSLYGLRPVCCCVRARAPIRRRARMTQPWPWPAVARRLRRRAPPPVPGRRSSA